MSGVPQGTVLAPLLFICYVNDLANLVNSRVRLYAADIFKLLYRTINTSDDNKLLQDDLDTLLNWSKTWKMSFNPSKCIHLKIINKHFPMQTSYYLDEYIIQQSQSATYLGVKIDQRLKWSEHISSTISKANAANAFLKHNLSGCSSKVKKHCYLSMVRPILEYDSIVWSPYTQCDIHKIEMVQRRAVRFILTISVVQLVLQTCL